MPKIPTFTARGRPTAETGSIQSNIKLDPRSSIAASILPVVNEVANYAIKKRDNEEKLIAKKTVLELKAESDKIIESQKDNISEEESINNWKNTFTPLIKQKTSTIKNRRIKKLVEQSIDLENSESVYHLKQNSFKAYEKESVKTYNDDINADIAKFKTETNPVLKDKYRNQLYIKAELFNEEHMLGSNDLKKRIENIKNILFFTDTQNLIGTDGGVEAINALDPGEKSLSNEAFGKTMYDVYSSKIESLTIKGDSNADFEQAEKLLIEMEKSKRSNGYKIIDDGREKIFGTLKQKVLTEKIGHDDLMFQIEQGKTVADYSDAQKTSLGGAFYNPMIMEKSGATAKALSNEAKAEYDIRYDEYLNTNSNAIPFEKQQFALELNLMLVDKYSEVTIEQLSTFNLDRNRFNVRREKLEIQTNLELYKANPTLPNKLKSLAKLNGYVDKDGKADVYAFLNVYEDVLKKIKD